MREDLKLNPAYDGFLFLAESARNPPHLASHHHAELELNLVVRGTVTYVVGGRRFAFPRRTLMWMFPSQEHQLVDRTDDAQYYVAVFRPEMIERTCRSKAYADLRRKRIACDGLLHSVLDPEAFDLLCRVMDEMMREALDPDILNREAGFGVDSDFTFRHGDPEGLNAGLDYLLHQCWRFQRTSERSGSEVVLHPSIRKVLDLLADDQNARSLSDLARRCGVSESYLSRLFVRQIGVPISRYRNSLRLSRFWQHYRRNTRTTVSEAVYAAGFGSYPQFFKVFSQAYGNGPRACLAEVATGSRRQ